MKSFIFVGLLLIIPNQGVAQWILSNPKVIDLKMSSDLFSEYRYEIKDNVVIDPILLKMDMGGALKRARDGLGNLETEKCHTQGVSIIDGQIVVSCCFYPTKYKVLRAYASQSFLLTADFKDILKNQTSIEDEDWKIKDVSEYIQVTSNGSTYTRVLGHPGGTAVDPESKQILMPLAVYNELAIGRFGLFNPKNLKKKSESIFINEHISIAGVLLKRFWVGSTWGSKQLMYVDSHDKSIQPRFEKAPSSPVFDYQDCETWDDRTLLCGANLATKSKENVDGKVIEWNIREGKLFFLEFSGNDLATLHLEKVTPVFIRTEKNEISDVLGKRGYRYIQGTGDIEKFPMNQYGTYPSQLTLTNEGLALSADRKYVYFLPDDIPGSKLIRYTLTLK